MEENGDESRCCPGWLVSSELAFITSRSLVTYSIPTCVVFSRSRYFACAEGLYDYVFVICLFTQQL